MRFINRDNLSDFAFVNLDAVQKPIRGVVMNCHGLTDESTFNASPRPGIDLGNEGVLYIFPYYSPWAWCNDATLAYMDEVLDVVWEMLDLPADLPFVIAGGSMGGMTSMLYSIYGKRRVKAVACNCPVCDLADRVSISDYVRRSVYAAYAGTERSVQEEILRHSPLHQVDALPDIPYLIVCGTKDTAIPEKEQIAPFQQAMTAAGKRATFVRVPGMGHCNIGDFEDAYQTYLHFCLRHLGLQA